MPSRCSIRRGRWALLLAALLVAVSACGDDHDEIAATSDQRADQARAAALDAGLDADVADFLALLARGDTATYEVRFPGPAEGTELVVVSRPPDRRVDLVSEGTATEVRLVTDGQAYTCTPADADADADADAEELTCDRTDALVDPPGVFRAEALADLGEALAERADDYTFDIEVLPVAGIEARCLVTRLRSGREAAELGASGTICASDEGAVVLVDQGGERLEALDYSTAVADGAFVRPDAPGSDEGT